MSDPVP